MEAGLLKGVDASLRRFVESEILPRYEAFDAGHRRDHAESVIARAVELAARLKAKGEAVDAAMVYVAAAYHDLGLTGGRERHHLVSGEIIRADGRLRRWFTEGQIETVAQAAEDHRASAKTPPRSVYGMIVAEADRQIVPETVIRRAVAYGLANYPDLDREAQYARMAAHVRDKYGAGGYLRLWLADSPNAAPLEQLRALIADDNGLRRIFDEVYPDCLT